MLANELTVFRSRGIISPFPFPFFGLILTMDASFIDPAYSSALTTGKRRQAYSSVPHSLIDSCTPSCRQESQGMSSEQEDTVDERPFFRYYPIVVFMIVGIVKEWVECCLLALVLSA